MLACSRKDWHLVYTHSLRYNRSWIFYNRIWPSIYLFGSAWGILVSYTCCALVFVVCHWPRSYEVLWSLWYGYLLSLIFRAVLLDAQTVDRLWHISHRIVQRIYQRISHCSFLEAFCVWYRLCGHLLAFWWRLWIKVYVIYNDSAPSSIIHYPYALT